MVDNKTQPCKNILTVRQSFNNVNMVITKILQKDTVRAMRALPALTGPTKRPWGTHFSPTPPELNPSGSFVLLVSPL